MKQLLLLILLLIIIATKSIPTLPPNPDPSYPPLDVNCTKNKAIQSYISCRGYLVTYLESYTGNYNAAKFSNDDAFTLPFNPGYNKLQIPVKYNSKDGSIVSPLIVYMSLQLDDFESIDTQAGIAIITANIDFWWYDYRLKWKSNQTLDIDTIFVESSWVWTPDIILTNHAEGYEMLSNPIEVKSDGLMHQSGKAYLRAICDLNLYLYPFDTQSCPFVFASWDHLDKSLKLLVQPVQFSDDDGYMLQSTTYSASVSWNLQHFTAKNYSISSRYEKGDYSFATWTIEASRYSTYYMSTAVMPDFTVALVCIFSLWIPSIDSRLAISMTGLLTIIAVLWTITSTLPSTYQATWISRFSNFCVIIVAIICIETTIVAYFETKKGKPPRWMRRFISYSKVFSWIYKRVFEFFVENCCDCFCIVYSMLSRKPNPKRRIKRQNNVMTKSFYTPRQSTIEPLDQIQTTDLDIEMSTIVSKTDDTKNNDSDDEIEGTGDEETFVDKPSEIGPHTANPMILNLNEKTDSDKEAESMELNHEPNHELNHEPNHEPNHELNHEPNHELDWIKFGRAIDRIARFILPLAFLIGLTTLYNETQNYCTAGLKACYVLPLNKHDVTALEITT